MTNPVSNTLFHLQRLIAYVDLDGPEDNEKFGRRWGIDPENAGGEVVAQAREAVTLGILRETMASVIEDLKEISERPEIENDNRWLYCKLTQAHSELADGLTGWKD